jgi:hypothetical protein
MNYESLQTDIAARLAQINTNPSAPIADVQALPEAESNYKRAAHDRPLITIFYTGSEYGKGNSDYNSISIDMVNQEETIGFQVNIEGKKLYGSTGVYAILNVVQSLLLGFSPDDCEKIHFKRSMLQRDEKDNTLFIFVLECIVKATIVEDVPPDTSALITQINYIL